MASDSVTHPWTNLLRAPLALSVVLRSPVYTRLPPFASRWASLRGLGVAAVISPVLCNSVSGWFQCRLLYVHKDRMDCYPVPNKPTVSVDVKQHFSMDCQGRVQLLGSCVFL